MTSNLKRRNFLRLGITGVSAAQLGALSGQATSALSMAHAYGNSFGRARSVIVVFCRGGMSHVDTFDMKPAAGSEIRGEFIPITPRSFTLWALARTCRSVIRTIDRFSCAKARAFPFFDRQTCGVLLHYGQVGPALSTP
jgi:hypothetical protein